MSALGIVSRVIAREGGIKDVGDGKGVTRFGQTPGWLEQFDFAPPETADEATQNYLAWLDRTGLDVVCKVDDVLADAVIDWSVHSGHERAIRALQSAIGARPDGEIGPETTAKLAKANRRAAAARVVADRVRHIGAVLKANPDRVSFAKGWCSRVASFVEQLA
jgi:lysozyme family protein